MALLENPAGSRRYRILALDIDGTLLDREGNLRPTTAAAVARAAAAGIKPVLCTGRRYRRARPIAQQLGLDAPLVCNSGALVKEPSNDCTIWRADFDPETLVAIFELFRDRDEPAVSFADGDPEGPDFLVHTYPTGRELFDDYVSQNLPHAGIQSPWQADGLRMTPHYHLCAIGTRPGMLDFEAAALDWLGPERVRTFVQRSPKYLGTMCELIRPDASKWSAVLHVAERWGVDASEICAVGDDMNDMPMIEGAGLGVAMGHAPEPVRLVADLVTGDHDNDGVTQLVDRVLLA